MDRPCSRRTLIAGTMLAPRALQATAAESQPAGSILADVPTFRGNNARTGEHPGPGPAGDPGPLWQARLGEYISASPVIASGIAYIGSLAPGTMEGGALHAVDAITGIELWRLPTQPGDGFFASAAVADGLVVTGSYDGIVIAADAATGTEQWRMQAEATFYASPALVGGMAWLADTAGHLYALDAESGAERWRVAVGDGTDRAFGTPAVEGDALYIRETPRRPGEPSFLHAYDAATGEERWRFSPDDSSVLRGGAVVADGVVYVLSSDTIVYAVDAATGEEREPVDIGSVSRTELALVDGVLYAGADDRRLHAIALDTREEIWNRPLNPEALPISAPCIADGVVYLGDTVGKMYAIDAGSGEVRWSVNAASLRSSPVVTGGRLYFGSRHGALRAAGGDAERAKSGPWTGPHSQERPPT